MIDIISLFGVLSGSVFCQYIDEQIIVIFEVMQKESDSQRIEFLKIRSIKKGGEL